MRLMSLPVLVERYSGEQAMTIICERCHTEAVLDPDELLNEGLYECPADTELSRRASAEKRCRGHAIMKYEEADKCKGCGKLGFYESAGPSSNYYAPQMVGCCSRRCMLVAEYAATLAEH
jgi:hypothetical protein